MVVGLNEVVAGSLAGGIGRAGVVGRVLGEIPRLAQRTEDLVGAHVVEQDVVPPLPCVSGHVQEGKGAHHVGLNESLGAVYGTVDVALGREVADGVNRVIGEDLLHRRAVAYIGLDEEVARTAVPLLYVGQALEIAGVGQRVEVDHAALEARLPEEVVDKV